MAIWSSALTLLASHGGVAAVPHHDGGAPPPPMSDVPPHSARPPIKSDRSTSRRSVYGVYTFGSGGAGSGAVGSAAWAVEAARNTRIAKRISDSEGPKQR